MKMKGESIDERRTDVRQRLSPVRMIVISPKTLWSVAGLIVLMTLLWAVVTRATSELIIVFFAIIIAEGIRPVVAWLRAHGIPHLLAILGVVFAVIAVLAGLIWLLINPLIVQIAGLVDDAPQLWNRAQQLVTRYETLLHNNAQARAILGQLPSRAEAVIVSKASLLVSTPLLLAHAIFDIILIVLLVIFWLSVSARVSTFVLSFVAPANKSEGRSILDDLSAKTGGYLRGVVINMGVIGIISGLGDHFLGVPYPLLLGVVAGLTESIPIAGPFLGGAAAVLVALPTMGWQKALEVVVLYLVIQQIEGNTLVPLVMNRAVNLQPFTIIIALIIGSALLGIPGAILSLPVAAIIKVLVVRVAAPSARRSLGASP